MIKAPASWTFAALAGVGAIAAWRSILATFALATQQDEYTHILLIIPIALAFLYLDRRALGTPEFANPAIGGMVLAVSAIAAVAGRLSSLSPDVQLSLSMAALVSWWIGSFIFCFGIDVARKMRFPLAFLYWLVPWPGNILDIAVGWLQRQSALAASWMFSLSRTPVSLDGTILTLPSLVLNVAPECSSLRSSLLLVITTMIFAQLFLQSPWRKLALVVAAILLSPVKNGFRIFVIGYLTLRVDPSYLTGHLHHDGGVVFLAIAQAIIFVLLWFLRRGETRRGTSASVQTHAY